MPLSENSFQSQPPVFKYWFVLTFIMGTTLVFLVPPFQSPDEFNHFYRIYQITEGKWVGEFNADSSQLGGYVPRSLITISKEFDAPLAVKSDFKVLKNAIANSWNVPLNKKDTVFINFPNTARYAPTAYLPQATTVIILKILDVSPLFMVYIGRLMTFWIWFFLMALIICSTPAFKELFMVISILPASLSINSTLNADIFTNALLFLVFALFFRFRAAQKIKISELLLFCTLILLTTVNKIVYFPILFLLLLVPTPKFAFNNQKVILIISLLVFNLMLILWWSHIINGLIYPDPHNLFRTTYGNMHQEVVINPALQTRHLLENPVKQFFYLAQQSVIILTTRTTSSWVASFGWDGYVPSGLSLAFILCLLIWTTLNNYKFTILERSALVLLAFGMTQLFILSQHLHWDGVGDYFDSGYLGKYFVPIFPLYFWSVSGLLSVSPRIKKITRSVMLIVLAIVYIDFWALVLQRYYI